MRYNIYYTISFVSISFVNCTVQKFVHAKYKLWTRYTKQFKCTFYILYAQTFLKLNAHYAHYLCIACIWLTYSVTGIPPFGMPLSPGSELTLFPAQFWLFRCQKRNSQQVRTCKGLSVWGDWFTIPSSIRTKRALVEVESDACWALVRSLRQQMSSTSIAIIHWPLQNGECHCPHKSYSEWTMADYKDFLVSEVIATGSEKEN